MNSRQVEAAHAFGEQAAKKWTKRSAVSVAPCRALAKEWLKNAEKQMYDILSEAGVYKGPGTE